MKVVELLKRASAKAGLIQLSAEELKAPEIPVVERKTVSLQQLQTEATESPKELEAPPPELTVGFDSIFEAVNLPVPAHGWTAERVRELLDSDDLKSKTPQEAGQAVLTALGQHQVTPQDILKDALARDQALDSYEEFVTRKLQQRAGDRQKAEATLEQQIRENQQQIRRLKDAQERDEKHFREWRGRKTQKEEELTRVASLFVSDHGITIGNNKNQK